MSEEEFDIVLTYPENWDEIHSAWKSKQLRLSGLRVTNVFAGGEQVPPHLFAFKGGLLHWLGEPAQSVGKIAVHYSIDDDALSELVGDQVREKAKLKAEKTTLEEEKKSLEERKFSLEKTKARWKAAAIVLSPVTAFATLMLKSLLS